MSSTDERLSELLAERARQGRVRPSLDGVHDAVAGRRTRRHRVIGSAAAGLLVLACLGAVVAASRTEGDTVPAPVADPDGGALPDLPIVGVEVDGFVPDEPQIGDLPLDDEPARTVVVFRSGRSLADPFVTVAVQPPIDGVAPEVRGDPTLDLDGDGLADAGLGGNDSGFGIEWRLTDGSVAMVGAELVDAESEGALITYAREVFGPTLDLDDLPSPAGLPDPDTWTFPDPRGPGEASVRYEADDDSGRWITISTTNQPGHFDLLQDSSGNPAEGFGFEEIALGPSFLGSGGAIVFDSYSGPGRDYALVRTDTGLTLEITTGCRTGAVCPRPALDAGSIRDVIRTGAFVEVEPADGPPTTAALTPATTGTEAPTTTSATSTPIQPGLPVVRHTVGASDEQIVIEFPQFPPDVGAVTLLEELTGVCAAHADAFDDGYRRDHEGNPPPFEGWLTLELGSLFVGEVGPVFDVEGDFIFCDNGRVPTTIAIPIANLGEPTVTPLSGRPAIVIDIPA